MTGWQVRLLRTRQDDPQDPQPASQFATTDANGRYSFNVAPGEYELSLVLQENYEPLSPRRRFNVAPLAASGSELDAKIDLTTGDTFSKPIWTEVAELNNDGLDDIAVLHQFSDGTGRANLEVFFSDPQRPGVYDRTAGNFLTIPMGVNTRPRFMKAVDALGSGALDLVIALNGDTSGRNATIAGNDARAGIAFGSIIVLQNNGNETFTAVDPMTLSPLDTSALNGRVGRPVNQTLGGNGPTHVAFGLVNGQRTMVITNSRPYDVSANLSPIVTSAEDISVAVQQANGIYAKRQSVSLSSSTLASGATAATLLDSDGVNGADTIAVALYRANQVALLRQPSSGQAFVRVGDIAMPGASYVLASDLNADNTQELLVAGSGGIQLFVPAAGQYQNNSPTVISTKAKAHSLSIGDIDGDGRRDILASFESDGSFQYFINTPQNTLFNKNDFYRLSFQPAPPRRASPRKVMFSTSPSAT